MFNDVKQKRERVGIEPHHRKIILEIVRSDQRGHLKVLEDKTSSKNFEKNEIWQKIANEFNEITGLGLERAKVKALYYRTVVDMRKSGGEANPTTDFSKYSKGTGGGLAMKIPEGKKLLTMLKMVWYRCVMLICTGTGWVSIIMQVKNWYRYRYSYFFASYVCSVLD